MKFWPYSKLKAAFMKKMWRTVLVRSMERLADNELDVLVRNFERSVRDNKDAALMNARLGSVGIDWLQELKDEKSLRNHRKKHGKVSERS